MYLKRLALSNFKNIESADLLFSPKINCIYGDNGEGKTNLLDAVFYLSMTKSFIFSTDRSICRKGTPEATLCGYYSLSELEEKISVGVPAQGEKIVRRNGKNYSRISDHIGFIPVVVISPSDTSLINDSGEERRRFMNMILSQTDREYLRSIQAYNRLLLQRNKLLKSDGVPSSIVLEAFDAKLDLYAGYIYNKRKELCTLLNPLSQHFYSILSGDKESVSLKYVSDMEKGQMSALLAGSYERDTLLRYTTVGVQRDDIEFELNDSQIKKYASQGQQKSFLISLKMAQLSIMKELYGFSPILLLDDVFDKLDMKRVEFLIGLVANEEFGQIFITDSNKVRISKIVNELSTESAFFSVSGGHFIRVNEDGEARG